MMGDDYARLIYLGLIALALLGWFLAQARSSLNKTLQQASVWALIFLGAIAAAGLWQDITRTVSPRQITLAQEGKVILPRAVDGHYYVTLVINGAPLYFVVDTGATNMVLTQKDAIAAGIDPATLGYFGRAMTANGSVKTARVTLDTVDLGGIVDRNIPAVVNSGEMSQSLLGMGYLERWGRIEIGQGQLVLTR